MTATYCFTRLWCSSCSLAAFWFGSLPQSMCKARSAKQKCNDSQLSIQQLLPFYLAPTVYIRMMCVTWHEDVIVSRKCPGCWPSWREKQCQETSDTRDFWPQCPLERGPGAVVEAACIEQLGDRNFEPRSPFKFRRNKMFLIRSLVNTKNCGESLWPRVQIVKARISNPVSGGQCHLIHLTILRRFTWPSLAYMC